MGNLPTREKTIYGNFVVVLHSIYCIFHSVNHSLLDATQEMDSNASREGLETIFNQWKVLRTNDNTSIKDIPILLFTFSRLWPRALSSRTFSDDGSVLYLCHPIW